MYYTRTVWSRRAQRLVFGACLAGVAAGSMGTLQARQDMPAPLSSLTSALYLRVERFSSPIDRSIELRFFLKPGSRGQGDRVVDVTRQSLRLYGDWFGPFPYPQLTVVDAPWPSSLVGTALPRAVVTSTRWLSLERDGASDRTLITAIAREYFIESRDQGTGGSNQGSRDFAEGLARYAAARAIDAVLQGRQHWSRRYFGGFLPYAVRSLPLSPPRSAAQGRRVYFDELAGDDAAIRAMLALQTLERYIGWPALQQGLAAYRTEFAAGGGTPEALQRILEEQGGRDLSSFFKAAFTPAVSFDYGVEMAASVSASESYTAIVALRRYGDGVFPVSYDLQFADGSKVTGMWPEGQQRVALEYASTSALAAVEVDPAHALLLDVDRANNMKRLTRARMPNPLVRNLASWLVWLQDLLLTASALS